MFSKKPSLFAVLALTLAAAVASNSAVAYTPPSALVTTQQPTQQADCDWYFYNVTKANGSELIVVNTPATATSSGSDGDWYFY